MSSIFSMLWVLSKGQHIERYRRFMNIAPVSKHGKSEPRACQIPVGLRRGSCERDGSMCHLPRSRRDSPTCRDLIATRPLSRSCCLNRTAPVAFFTTPCRLLAIPSRPLSCRNLAPCRLPHMAMSRSQDFYQKPCVFLQSFPHIPKVCINVIFAV